MKCVQILKQVRMYYGSGTVDRIASGEQRANAVCALTRWQHFDVWNDNMAAILKVWLYITNPTHSTDAHLLEEQSYQFSSRSDLKRIEVWKGFFEECHPKNNNNNNNKMSSDMGSKKIDRSRFPQSTTWYIQCHDEEQIQTAAVEKVQKVWAYDMYAQRLHFAASDNCHIWNQQRHNGTETEQSKYAVLNTQLCIMISQSVTITITQI